MRLPVCFSCLLAVWAMLGLPETHVLAGKPAERTVSPELGEGQSTAGETGVLLLRDGRVVRGRILRSGESYIVENQHGRAVFFDPQVRSRCADLHEAYRLLQSSVHRDGTAPAFVTLARWCLTNQLLPEARQELQRALAVEPGRDEARALLRRVETLLDPRHIEATRPAEPSRPGKGELVDDDTESLGGLSRSQAQQFTRRIQPILVNNCASSGCHTSDADNGFRLLRVAPGADTSRLAAERNLADVLEQVDASNPRSSPLLTVPRGNHGRRGKPVFSGPRGEAQFVELRRWVQSVARTEVARARREGRQAVADKSPVKSPTPGVTLPAAKAARLDGSRAKPSPDMARRKAREESETQASQPPLELPPDEPDRLPDPFDPVDFNRGAAAQPK